MSVKNEEVIAGCLIGLGFLLLLVFFFCYFTIAGGIVLSSFWAWFLLPLFPSLPQIGIAQSIGITMLFGALNQSWAKAIMEFNKKQQNKSDEGSMAAVGFIFLLLASPWLTLLGGYVFKSLFL